jgi:pimeloyl-ACP methyl ester carboxylesterase
MTTSEHVLHSDIAFRRHRAGRRAVVFVHGFLDDQFVWRKVIADLRTPGFETVSLDLAGMGDRAGASAPFTYERFAADVGLIVDTVDKPFVIVGHSMGAPIAELVATARPGRALGLVLLAPAPLAGMRLPDEAIVSFRSLGGDLEGQRAVRRRLAVSLSDADLDRLVAGGAHIRPGAVCALADCWNEGLPDRNGHSAYTGPVLILRGAGDSFISENLVSTAITPRFASAQTVAIEGAGHWPQLEQPSAVAGQLDDFLTRSLTVGDGVITAAVRPQNWTDAFASKSAERFGTLFADDVVLEGANLRCPVVGREQVMRVMGTASGIYDSLLFTHEARNGPRTYLEWEATALGGLDLRGVTVLVEDDSGQVVHAAIHHRPLGAALRFSAELRKRLAGVVDESHFYESDADGARLRW